MGLRGLVGVTSNVARREVLGGAHHESVGWGVRGHLSSHAGLGVRLSTVLFYWGVNPCTEVSDARSDVLFRKHGKRVDVGSRWSSLSD